MASNEDLKKLVESYRAQYDAGELDIEDENNPFHCGVENDGQQSGEDCVVLYLTIVSDLQNQSRILRRSFETDLLQKVMHPVAKHSFDFCEGLLFSQNNNANPPTIASALKLAFDWRSQPAHNNYPKKLTIIINSHGDNNTGNLTVNGVRIDGSSLFTALQTLIKQSQFASFNKIHLLCGQCYSCDDFVLKIQAEMGKVSNDEKAKYSITARGCGNQEYHFTSSITCVLNPSDPGTKVHLHLAILTLMYTDGKHDNSVFKGIIDDLYNYVKIHGDLEEKELEEIKKFCSAAISANASGIENCVMQRLRDGANNTIRNNNVATNTPLQNINSNNTSNTNNNTSSSNNAITSPTQVQPQAGGNYIPLWIGVGAVAIVFILIIVSNRRRRTNP